MEIVCVALLLLSWLPFLGCHSAAVPSITVEEELPDLQASLVQMSISRLPGGFDPLKVLNLDTTPVLERMIAEPRNLAVQLAGCTALAAIISEKHEVTQAVVKPMVDAIINNVDRKLVVKACFFALLATRPTFVRPVTLVVNNGTNLAEAIALVQRTYAEDRDMQKDVLMFEASFASRVACDVQEAYVKAGCMDNTWDALDRFKGREYSDVQMSAWQGLSDYASCAHPAEVIVNNGGKNARIPFIVQALREAVGNQYHPDVMHGGELINLQYEVMTVANGILGFANATNGRFEAFVKAGYGDAVLSSMRDQPDERSTNDRGCKALQMLSENETVAHSLWEADALKTIVAAMDKFKGSDERLFVLTAMSDNYPVLPHCDGALRNFATHCSKAQDELLQLGVLDVYDSMRQDLLPQHPEMSELPGLLRARLAQLRNALKQRHGQ